MKTEGGVPGDVQVLPDVPHRARGRVRDRRDEDVGSSTGHDQPGSEGGLDGEGEECSDGCELGEHGCGGYGGVFVHEELKR